MDGPNSNNPILLLDSHEANRRIHRARRAQPRRFMPSDRRRQAAQMIGEALILLLAVAVFGLALLLERVP